MQLLGIGVIASFLQKQGTAKIPKKDISQWMEICSVVGVKKIIKRQKYKKMVKFDWLMWNVNNCVNICTGLG